VIGTLRELTGVELLLEADHESLFVRRDGPGFAQVRVRHAAPHADGLEHRRPLFVQRPVDAVDRSCRLTR
jgi:hypothetical protein